MEVGSGAGEDVGSLEGGPFSVLEDARVVGGACREIDRLGVNLGAGIARVCSVGGVIDGAVGVGVDDAEGGEEVVVLGGVYPGIEVAGAELVEGDGGALLEVGAEDVGLDGVVMFVAGVEFEVGGLPTTGGLDVAAVVSPTGGFGDEGEFHVVGAATPDDLGHAGCEGAVIEEGGVGTVGEAEAVFGVFGEVLVNAGGAVVSVEAGSVDVEGSVDGGGGGACGGDGEFGVPGDDVEGDASGTGAGGAPVVAVPVVVADEEVDEHVVDEGVDIEVRLHGLVDGGRGDVPFGDVGHGVEGGDGAVGGLAGVDGVVVIVLAAEVGFHEVLVGAFVNVVEAPVDTIDVEVEPAPVDSGVVHFEEEIVDELVAGVLGFVGLPEVAVGPAEVVAGAELEGIEVFDGVSSIGGVFEERIVEFSGAVVVAEAEGEGVFGGVGVAAGSALDAESGIDLEAGFRAVVRDEFGGDGAFPSRA